ncbi:MAG: beta-ketoacyl-[acyl-carrier-protein] synthase II [Deltaproteobacteria bacterium CG_4_8_14_3_um_filter_51_11]|nr:beta-ketoacyl-ACP synthase II [bacterium]PIP46136.1 MAG: beta-ketoacyl-[acyl-carrier-protein] synthase II [Deltaproteobacteria bacterium CG23_combo_of_CG06-09_8_20_14_all_51_20]PIX20914.1 MAG: beta-ketoacyl-[acyl-carrier-protein] synthase II [Deltaproteobacteria bacterium CG_4_8_14_3_um_filter_51_11]PIY23227.1 MAG: beta-ketoacyl-[acyl-carrier-protein] synthase II [Deltaproteobacteria bacterium CG_4_10_14_3_um_filter_51_14]PJB35487.1 MAG: beta-ketoacyl-[acyl-carrier-protein] synthase II [Delt
MTRRVVVTGMGMVSPLGTGVENNWKALCEGVSGIGPITKFDVSDFPTRIGGEVRGFKAEDYVDKQQLRRLDIFIHFALASARMAFEDSRLKIDPSDGDRVGCITGSGLGGLTMLEQYHSVLIERGPSRVSPFFIPGIIANMAPGMIAIEFGIRGPNLSIETACAASSHAIGEAYRYIKEGRADVMVTGGAEAVITPLALGGFCSMRALSTRNDEPEKASRPFELNRDGFVIGEGSGILILEELERAIQRNAPIYAELIGYGSSADAYHISAPDPDGRGAATCMKAALADAGIRPENVDYINAHGTSTKLNDLAENKAIKAVFGEHAYKLAVSSTKSMTGHLLGGAGGVEAIYTVLSLKNGILPPTINYENQDPECDLDYVPNKARKKAISYAISNSFGFGGTNATLVFKPYDA